MNEKFNKNAKVEQLTIVVLSHGEEKGLIVKDPFPFFARITEHFQQVISADYVLVRTTPINLR